MEKESSSSGEGWGKERGTLEAGREWETCFVRLLSCSVQYDTFFFLFF